MKITTIFKLFYINLKTYIFIKILKKKPLPYKVLIQLTNDCNSKCINCSIWKINLLNPNLKNQELKLEEYNHFFSQYGKHIYWLSLSGGEISQYNEINKLIEIVKRNCPNLALINFTTNAIEVDKILNIANFIKSSLKKTDFFVNISLDGDQNLHDKIRGIKGNYAKAILLKEKLKDFGIQSHFGATLSNLNAEFLAENLSSEIKAISLVHSDGIYNAKVSIEDFSILKSLKIILKKYEINNLGEFIEYLYLKIGYKFLKNKRSYNHIPCEVINTSIHLSPYGDILPCMYMPSLGNLKNNEFISILNSESTKHTLELIKKNKCPKCWMNCYAPHSMALNPISLLREVL